MTSKSHNSGRHALGTIFLLCTLLLMMGCMNRQVQGENPKKKRKAKVVVVMSSFLFMDSVQEEFAYTLQDLFRDRRLNWDIEEDVGLPEPRPGGVNQIPPAMLRRWAKYDTVVFLHGYVLSQRLRHNLDGVASKISNESGYGHSSDMAIASSILDNLRCLKEESMIVVSAYDPIVGKRFYLQFGKEKANNPRRAANLLYTILDLALSGLYKDE